MSVHSIKIMTFNYLELYSMSALTSILEEHTIFLFKIIFRSIFLPVDGGNDFRF